MAKEKAAEALCQENVIAVSMLIMIDVHESMFKDQVSYSGEDINNLTHIFMSLFKHGYQIAFLVEFINVFV